MKPAPPVTRIIGAARLRVRRVPDVILPVLNEREALPWVLERMPDGYTPIVVDNGSTDGSGELAASLGARVVVEPVPGLRRRLLRRAERGDRATSCASWTATRRSIRATCRASPTRSRAGAADLMLGARQPDRARRLAAARAGREHGAGGRAAPAHEACRCATSARCAPRAARRCSASGIRDRRFGWPLEMVLRAADAGWTIREVPVAYHPRDGPLEGHGDACAGPPAPCAT